ncbi:ribonuclease HI family protein [Candidatus Woesebacteria bacterium]|nr:ribonuclease HI family protein [Candidatus Woesebacteria bacterium]
MQTKDQQKLTIFTDGGSRGNPGPAAVGVAFFEGETEVFRLGQCIGNQTNNVAEYQAFLLSLSELKMRMTKNQPSSIQWYLDSKLVVEQLNQRWKIKDPNLKVLWQTAISELSQLGVPYSISHIPREENTLADKMVNQALDGLT